MNIAIVSAEYNEKITDQLLAGAVKRLLQLGCTQEQITITKVPGAVEIPLIAKLHAKSGKFAAIICLGAVIRGETNHYDYVCQWVTEGCLRVTLDCDVPVIFGVQTTDNLEQALARVDENNIHKGIEAADTAIKMINIVKACTH
jgi:6,7-dimethyl-8-ribityllumazine synthase